MLGAVWARRYATSTAMAQNPARLPWLKPSLDSWSRDATPTTPAGVSFAR